MLTVAITGLVWATLSATICMSGLFLLNLLFFSKAPTAIGRLTKDRATGIRYPGEVHGDAGWLQVSVLIPARNEALRIGPLLDSVLSSEGVRCEIWVLDDESQDGTEGIVLNYSSAHAHVRLIRGKPVPAGWSGKQFACWQLAQLASFPELVFLDADVALAPDALRRASRRGR